MVMRIPLIAGNWKMNGSVQSSHQLLSELCAKVDSYDDRQMVLCPPYPYLQLAANAIKEKPVMLGGQNLALESGSGAFTGEVSGEMLRDFGCKYVIVGHSERRMLYGETDRLVAKKFIVAQEQGLKPILCVGETLEDRESDRTSDVVKRQVKEVMVSAGLAAFSEAVIAYEPVWAIGTGQTALPDQVQKVHSIIRALIAEEDATIADNLRILYGGSLKSDNAREIFDMDDIDGGLVGGASLDVNEFLSIFQAA